MSNVHCGWVVERACAWLGHDHRIRIRWERLLAVYQGFLTFVALLQGYEAQPTPEGVSRATTRTVVMASLAVLGLDFVLTAMMFSI